jgi:3-oxoacyl-[acyl-carrier protein] reductase
VECRACSLIAHGRDPRRGYHDAVDLGLSGRRYLVGGGSRGLGAAIAEALVGEGASVAIMARDSEELTTSAERIGARALPVDLAKPDGPEAAVRRAVSALGGLDGILVNSGGPPVGTFEALDEAAWSRAIDGTLLSAIRLIRASLGPLREGSEGTILLILSSSVREPVPGLVTSNVLRPGLAGLIKTLVAEVAPIRVNGIAPGRIDTDRVRSLDRTRATETNLTVEEVQAQNRARIPLGRYGEPPEVGRIGAFLLSPAASYINGAIIPVDGGMVRSLP